MSDQDSFYDDITFRRKDNSTLLEKQHPSLSRFLRKYHHNVRRPFVYLNRSFYRTVYEDLCLMTDTEKFRFIVSDNILHRVSFKRITEKSNKGNKSRRFELNRIPS